MNRGLPSECRRRAQPVRPATAIWLFSDKVVDHLGFTQPPQCNLVTQMAGAKVLL